MVIQRILSLLSRLSLKPKIERPCSKHIALYQLSTEAGMFAMVGFSMVGGKTCYQLEHLTTGKTFTISKHLFELLFESKG